jgi:hypothetical protein
VLVRVATQTATRDSSHDTPLRIVQRRRLLLALCLDCVAARLLRHRQNFVLTLWRLNEGASDENHALRIDAVRSGRAIAEIKGGRVEQFPLADQPSSFLSRISRSILSSLLVRLLATGLQRNDVAATAVDEDAAGA